MILPQELSMEIAHVLIDKEKDFIVTIIQMHFVYLLSCVVCRCGLAACIYVILSSTTGIYLTRPVF